MNATVIETSAPAMSPVVPAQRWNALDVLRGLTIMLMLLNLSPGSWEFNYSWLEHVKWEGWHVIDMVAPAFLFCIGAAMPLSFARRSAHGATRGDLLRHVASRGLLLVAIGFFLNLYPDFDFAHVRIPGVLSRIGLCYLIAGAYVIATGTRARPALIACAVILVSYWALLYYVPVPGFGAPRFDPVGSWPSVIDRAVIGVDHFFKWWPVDGKVVFDPEGILSTWPACFNILFGVLVGIAFSQGAFDRGPWKAIAVGAVLVLMAYALQSVCPIVKNLWTSTFALLSSGFTLCVLGLLTLVLPRVSAPFAPARVFGENPLLAYILCFLIAPLVDANFFGGDGEPRSLRNVGQAFFAHIGDPRAASMLFGLCGLAFLYAVLLVCQERRWILKL